MTAHRLRQLSALLAAPLLLSPSLAELQFAPSEGTTLRYTLSQNLTLEVEEVEMGFTVDGEEHPGRDMSEMELTITENEAYVFVDEYSTMGESAPLRFSRTYESLSSDGGQDGTDPEGEPISEEKIKSTDLEGKTVVFAWDAEDEEWSKSFAEDSEGDDDWLEGLEAEVFFTALLPDGDAEAGATWEIEPRVFLEATNPGGDIPWDEDEEEDGDDSEDLMLDNLEGTVTAEFVGLADEDGSELATIRFTAMLTSEFDDAPPENDEMPMEMESSGTLSFEMELEGELVWDVKAGHARSLSVSGPISLDQDMTQSSDGEVSFEMKMHQRFVGTIEINVEVE